MIEQKLIARLEGPVFATVNWFANKLAKPFPFLRQRLDRAANDFAEGAQEHASAGRNDQAIVDYRRALARSPEDTGILLAAASHAYDTGEYREAIRLFRRLVDRNHRDSQGLKGLAFALHAGGQVDEAVYRYYRYLDANKDDYDALVNLSALLLDSSQNEEAIEYSERAARIRPNEAAPVHNIALANFNLGRFDDAEEYIRRAVEIEPSPDSYRLYGLLLETRGELQRSIEQYLRAIEAKPDFADAWLDVARLQEKLGQPVQYLASARKAVELAERHESDFENLSRAYWDLGWAYYENGDLAESARASRRSVELNPNSSPPRFNLGLALLLLGQTDEARHQYALAVKQSRRSDIKGDGIDDLQAALKNNPDIEGGQEILDMLLAEYNKFDIDRRRRNLAAS